MLPGAYDLKEYYATPQGRMVARMLLRRFAAWWDEPRLRGEVVVGAGYALPYLESMRAARGVFALMSGQMGAMTWPEGAWPDGDGGADARQRCVLADRGAWPLAGASVDYVLVIHDLEFAEDPGAVLDEVWRVLKPEGRAIMVVPNRTGLWARVEKTPFGQGRPFTATQLHELLRERNFSLERMTGALVAPPVRNVTLTEHVAPAVEAIAPACSALCGVIVAEAGKRLYQPIKGKAKPVAKPALIWGAGVPATPPMRKL
ncbi:MAG: methyltransferase domain-containing protein [Rhodospirillales bacterium]|nr:methyltransferase domain-containing protein [Alphaproteobacteria bacterium]MCB9987247.1 methyltransferase domain-containing protein [Rhodospirillales bacterium]USO07892.1 MAG: methyltransferase domain-containing protein [Rhodospirillales bacterium]